MPVVCLLSERLLVCCCVYFVIMTELRESVKHTCVVGDVKMVERLLPLTLNYKIQKKNNDDVLIILIPSLNYDE